MLSQYNLLAKTSVYGLLSVVSVGLAAPAAAKITANTNPSEQATSGDDPQSAGDQSAGDIVVTAQKREQNLQDVGLSVTALGAETLKDQRVSSLSDLANVVPGLNFTQSTANTPVYTLRGVGFFESSLASYPDVATYIDQFPLPFPVTSTLVAFDLERVEVLKGPQGTLFGNNATGGAINFIAAKPKAVLGAGFQLSYGRFNNVIADAYITGPLSQNINVRVAARKEYSDEWQKSYTSNDRLGNKDNVAGRLLIDFTPTETLRFNLNVNGWQNHNDPQAPQFYKRSVQNQPGAPGPFANVPTDLPIFTYPLASADARAADFGAGGRPFSDNSFWQAAFRGDLDINDVLTLTSLTSYLRTKIDERLDTDGTALEVADLTKRRGRVRSFNQEVRLAANFDNKLRLLVGGNYEKSKVLEANLFLSGDSTSGVINQFSQAQFFSDQNLRNWAVFGNGEFKLNDAITLKGGVRYTEAKRSTRSGNRQDPDTADRFPVGVTQFFKSLIRKFSRRNNTLRFCV